MKKKQTVDEFVERPEAVIVFGDNRYARAVCGRLMQNLNDKQDANVNCVMVRDDPSEKSRRQFNRYELKYKKGAKEVFLDVNCVSRVIDGYNDYETLSSLADDPNITTVLWAPKAKNWLLDNGRMKNEKHNLLALFTMLLFRRFCLEMRGFEIISLMNEDQNGEALRNEIIEYADIRGLGMDFVNWLTMEVRFINTFIETRVGNETIDSGLIVDAEKYFLCVFDKKDGLLSQSKLVTVNSELSGYYVLRRHIYEGALCSACAYSLLHDVNTLDAFMFREKLVRHMTVSVFEEIIPSLNVNFETVQAYTVEMLQRFEDASVTVKWHDYKEELGEKFASSLIPVIRSFVEIHERVPKHLVFALFCTLKLYSISNIGDTFSKKLKASKNILKDKALWGEDISYLEQELDEFERKMG